MTYPVAIQERVEVDDAYDEGDDWRTIATRSVELKGATGRERVEADAVKGRTTSKMTMRRNGISLTSAHRILGHDGRIFNIESVVIPDPRGRWQMATVVEER